MTTAAFAAVVIGQDGGSCSLIVFKNLKQLIVKDIFTHLLPEAWRASKA